jgi:hypothetical protein
MSRIFAVLGLLVLMGCEGPQSGPFGIGNGGPLAGTYAGADGGYLIMSLTARRAYGLAILFRRRDRSATGTVWWGRADMFMFNIWQPLDIRDGMRKERGIVDVRRLPPGDYEIYNFRITYGTDEGPAIQTAGPNFSIPFSIAPGRTTYVGNFMGVQAPAGLTSCCRTGEAATYPSLGKRNPGRAR